MRGRSMWLGGVLLVSLLGLAGPVSAGTTGLHLENGPADEHGCHPLEVWNADTLVRSIPSAWDQEHCSAQRQQRMLGDLLFFDWWGSATHDGLPGEEGTLWATDGTTDGTIAVADLWDYWAADYKVNDSTEWFRIADAIYVERDRFSHPIHNRSLSATTGLRPVELLGRQTVVLGFAHGRLYLLADRPDHGRELYATDGTSAGTHVVRDIRPGAAGSQPGRVLRLGLRYLFVADDGIHGREFWIANLSTRGTRLLRDAWPGPRGSDPHAFRTNGSSTLSMVCFQTRIPGSQAWITDGTRKGTGPRTCPF